jgi:hypothetical protein
VNLVDERYDLSDLTDDDSPVTRAMCALEREHLMPPASSVGALEDGPVIVSGNSGFTPEQISRIEAALVDIPHRVVAHPVQAGIYYGGSGAE